MISKYAVLLLIAALTGCAQPNKQVFDMNYPIYNMLSAPGHEAVFQVQPNTIELHIVSQESWKATQPPDRLAYTEIKHGDCNITIPSGYVISYDSYRGKAQWTDSKMDEILVPEILHCYIFDWHAAG
jgi:hypothetical protein